MGRNCKRIFCFIILKNLCVFCKKRKMRFDSDRHICLINRNRNFKWKETKKYIVRELSLRLTVHHFDRAFSVKSPHFWSSHSIYEINKDYSDGGLGYKYNLAPRFYCGTINLSYMLFRGICLIWFYLKYIILKIILKNIIKFPFKKNGLPCCEDANTFR